MNSRRRGPLEEQTSCFWTPQPDPFALLVSIQKFYTRLGECFLDRQHRADPHWRVHERRKVLRSQPDSKKDITSRVLDQSIEKLRSKGALPHPRDERTICRPSFMERHSPMLSATRFVDTVLTRQLF